MKSQSLTWQLRISEIPLTKTSDQVLHLPLNPIGKLKVEYTENILVDVRQALVNCDQNKNRIMKEVDKTMTDLINSLKTRKNELIVMIDEYFKAEREKVAAEE